MLVLPQHLGPPGFLLDRALAGGLGQRGVDLDGRDVVLISELGDASLSKLLQQSWPEFLFGRA